MLTLIPEICLVRSQDLADRVARRVEFSGDALHRPALHMKRPTHLRYRITRFNAPSIRCLATDGQMKPQRGQNWTPITPLRGSVLHAETHSDYIVWQSFQIACALRGVWLTSSPSAFATAFAIAAAGPIVPPSPSPLAPSGVSGVGVSK